jgi:hypothetical protein
MSLAGSRYAAGVEYDGSQFHGWQYQCGQCSVQEAVESALSYVADHPVRVIAAGRTDTGVHGIGQVIHFDSAQSRSLRAWLRGTNAHLPTVRLPVRPIVRFESFVASIFSNSMVGSGLICWPMPSFNAWCVISSVSCLPLARAKKRWTGPSWFFKVETVLREG